MGLGGVGVQARRSGDALCRACAARHRGAADRALKASPRRRPAPAARSGRGLVCRQHPDRHAAAGECGRRAHRLQDRHLLRLSRCLGGRLRRPHTIGVWVGRPDGAPVPGLVGRAAAAPILFDAFARTGTLPAPLPRAPKGALFAATGKLPPPLQRFRPGGAGRRRAEPPRIMFPPDGARLELASGGGGSRTRSRSRLPAAPRRSP